MQGDKWRETNEEGRLGAAAISVISMQGDQWRRETRSGSDFGNQHAGRQMKGDKRRRETRSGSDFGNQHAGRQMKGDKWRRETRSGSDFGNQHAGRQMKGDKRRRETRSGSDFGNQHAGRQMKGDKWRRETRSGSDFGNQQPNLWEVRTPMASSYLGKNLAPGLTNTLPHWWSRSHHKFTTLHHFPHVSQPKLVSDVAPQASSPCQVSSLAPGTNVGWLCRNPFAISDMKCNTGEKKKVDLNNQYTATASAHDQPTWCKAQPDIKDRLEFGKFPRIA